MLQVFVDLICMHIMGKMKELAIDLANRNHGSWEQQAIANNLDEEYFEMIDLKTFCEKVSKTYHKRISGPADASSLHK